MAGKRVLSVVAMAILAAATGCRAWCDRCYPCNQGMNCQSACVPCVPICQPGVGAGFGPGIGAPINAVNGSVGYGGGACVPCVPAAMGRN